MAKLLELRAERVNQFQNLGKQKRFLAQKHFVDDPGSKWLELSRSKRVEVDPPPIVSCILSSASDSLIAGAAKDSVKPNRDIDRDIERIAQSNVMMNVPGAAGKLPLPRGKGPPDESLPTNNNSAGDLSRVSAAAAMDWSMRQRHRRNQLKAEQRNNDEGDDASSTASLPAYDRFTKRFDRHDVGKLRKDPVYQRKRAGRYKLERDKMWLSRSSNLHATVAQDPILPFMASSVGWFSRPGLAVPLAAAQSRTPRLT